MIGFAVYSTTADPDRLYSAGDTGAIDASETGELIWAGEQPLEMVVDLDDRRVWWVFEADHETKARRTGHFIAAYHGGLDLFSGFADTLGDLHETDGWELSRTGALRQNAGFELRGLSPTFEDDNRFDRLVDRLGERDGSHSTPLRVGMRSYRSALEAVRSLEVENVACTVAVDATGDTSTSGDIDLVLVPGASRDFEGRSRARASADTAQGGRSDVGSRSTRDTGPSGEKGVATGSDTGGTRTLDGFTVRIAAIALVGLFGFATYSFVQRQPVVPISGLGMFGGFFGACGAVVLRHAAVDTGGTLRERLADNVASIVPLVTGGAFAGFVFPRIFWEAGQAVGRDGFLFGSLDTISGSLPATLAYVGCLLVGTVVVLTVGSRTGYARPVTKDRFVRLSLGFVVYGVCLLLATGLAESVWYAFIPSV
jgi:hypothetical protein